MVCKFCKNQDHGECPEKKRQADETLGRLERSCGQLCDCGHVTVTDLSAMLGTKEVVE